MNNYSYKIEGIILTKGEHVFLQGNKIKSLTIVNNYENYIYPVIIVEALLNVDEYKEITKNDLVTLSISMNNSNEDGYDYIIKNKIFNILDIENFYVPKQEDNSRQSTDNFFTCKIVVIDKDCVDLNNCNIHGNYNNTDLNSIILLASKKISNKKIHLEKSDNDKIFRQIVIPFGNINKSLKYVDKVYGIFHDGIKIFFDLDDAYIMSDNKNKLNEKKTLIFDVKDSSDVISDTKSRNTIDILSNDISYKEVKNVKDKVLGNKNSYILDDNEEKIMVLNSKNDEDMERRNVYYQKYKNPFTKDIIENTSPMVVNIVCRNYNFSDMNCMNYYIINEPTKIFDNNLFILTQSMNHFGRTKDGVYELTGKFNLKKI